MIVFTNQNTALRVEGEIDRKAKVVLPKNITRIEKDCFEEFAAGTVTCEGTLEYLGMGNWCAVQPTEDMYVRLFANGSEMDSYEWTDALHGRIGTMPKLLEKTAKELCISSEYKYVSPCWPNPWPNQTAWALCARGSQLTSLAARLKKGKKKEEKQKYHQFLDALIRYLPSRDALILLDKEGLLEYAAWIHSVDADELREKTMYDFGLDEAGTKVFDLGNGLTVNVQLEADLTLTLTDNKGKQIKSVPAKGAEKDKRAEAKADLADMKKNIKAVASRRAVRLRGDFAEGKAVSPAAWKETNMTNPVIRRVASLLVWDADGVRFMPTMDGRTVDASGREVILPEESTVKLAHPCELPGSETEDWKAYITDHHIAQPFTQMFETVYPLEGMELGKRYDGLKVLYVKMRSLENEGTVKYSESAKLYGTEIGCTIEHGDGWGGDWAERLVTLHAFDTGEAKGRTLNHVVYLMDVLAIDGAARGNRTDILAAQSAAINEKNIGKLIDTASGANATEATAWLLNFKQEHFAPDNVWDDLEL